MNKNSVKRNSWRAWVLASRPKTLAGATAPVLVAGSLARAVPERAGEAFPWLPFLLCLLFAWLMQVASNFVNDWYDYKKGTDTAERLGPERACAQGWVSLRAMRRATALVMLLASLVGLPLIFYGGPAMLAVGAACLLFCVLYTTCFSYLGLGDVLVVLFFGVVPVCVTYYILTGTMGPTIFFVSLAVGLTVDCLLIVNNFRDRDTDALAGKRTIVVRIGAEWALRLYLFCGLAAVGMCLPLTRLFGWGPIVALLPYAVLHYMACHKMRMIFRGRALNMLLGDTSRNILLFALSLSAAVLLA